MTEVQEQPNQDTETLKEVQPENTEAAPQVNGTTPNLKTTIETDESETIISDHPMKGTVEDVSGWSEWFTKEQPKAAGTSSQPPPPKKDKIQIPRSQETCNRNRSTEYTRSGTGRTRPTRSYREA
jgi:hypothetical protein